MTKDELAEWKDSKLTKEILAYIKARKLALEEVVQERGTNVQTIAGPNFVREQAYYLGHIDGLNAILDVEFEDEEDETDDTVSSTGTQGPY